MKNDHRVCTVCLLCLLIRNIHPQVVPYGGQKRAQNLGGGGQGHVLKLQANQYEGDCMLC